MSFPFASNSESLLKEAVSLIDAFEKGSQFSMNATTVQPSSLQLTRQISICRREMQARRLECEQLEGQQDRLYQGLTLEQMIVVMKRIKDVSTKLGSI